MTKQFYAYIHARPDGTPFYVGKGYGLRSHRFWSRSAHHQNIVAKCGGQDKILISRYLVSSETFAFELEKGLIKTLRRMGYKLCNLTDGGDGVTGYKHDPEFVKRHAEMIRGRKRTPETRAKHSATMKELASTSEWRQKMSEAHMGHTVSLETREKMSKKLKGRVYSAEALANITEGNRRYAGSPEAKALSIARAAKQSATMKARFLQDPTLRALASERLRGRPVSEATRKKQSDRARSRSPISEATRKRISEGAKRGWAAKADIQNPVQMVEQV